MKCNNTINKTQLNQYICKLIMKCCPQGRISPYGESQQIAAGTRRPRHNLAADDRDNNNYLPKI